MACDDADTAAAVLLAALAGPKRVQGDAGEVEQFSLKDMIEAVRFLRASCAGSNRRQGMRITQLVPDGTAGSTTGGCCDGGFNRLC